MLENIRKYSALMIIVVALLAFGLIVTLNDPNASGTSQGDIIVVNDEGMSKKEFVTQRKNPLEVYQSVGSLGINSEGMRILWDAVSDYTKTGYPEVEQIYAPAVTQLLVREEAKRLGVFVTLNDAEKFIKEELFIDQEGEVDESAYKKFEERGLKNLGMTVSAFKQYIANILLAEKIKQIKSVQGIPSSLGYRFGQINQQFIDASVVQVDMKDIIDEVEAPSDQRIEDFYNENKNSSKYGTKYFRTKPEIVVTYVPVNLKPLPKIDVDAEGLDAVNRLQEEKDLREATYKRYRKMLKDEALFGDKPDLNALAKKYDLDVVTSELVNEDDLAKDLKNTRLLGEYERRTGLNGQSYMLFDHLYSEMSKASQKLEVFVEGGHSKSFVHYRIDKYVKPRLKTLTEAKDDIKQLIIELDQDKALKAAAEAVKVKVDEAIKNKTDIAKAIEGSKAKIVEVKDLKFTGTEVEGLFIPANQLFEKAKTVNTVGTTAVMANDNGASFVVVKSRKIEQRLDSDGKVMDLPKTTDLSSLGDWRSFGIRRDYFVDGYYEWLNQSFVKAKADGNVTLPEARQ